MVRRRARTAGTIGAVAVLATVLSSASEARAEDAPRMCSAGLVLGVGPDDAATIVDAVCRAPAGRATSDLVRIAILRNGDGPIVVVVTRTNPDTGKEKVDRIEAPTVAEARRRSAALLGAPQAPAPAPAPEPAPRAEAEPDRDRDVVYVSIEAPDYTLELSRDGAAGWEVVCENACTKELPRRASYRFVDRKGQVKQGFRLKDDGSGATKVRFSPRSSAMDIVGVSVIVVGSISLLAAFGSDNGKGDGLAAVGLLGIGLGSVLVGMNGASVDQSRWSGREPERARRPEAFLVPPGRSISATLIDVRF